MEKEQAQKNITYPNVGLKDILRAFWNGIKPQKWLLFILVASIILGNVVTIITPLFYKQFFDIIASAGLKSEISPKLFILIFS